MVRFASCAGLAVVVAALACSDLSPIEPDVCGNGALDPGEDCDGSAGSGEACGAPGEPNGCYFTCGSGIACPTGYACGLDSRCRAPSNTFALAPGPVKFLASTFHGGDVDGDGYADLSGMEGDTLQVYFSNAQANLQDSTTQVVPTSGLSPGFGDLDGDGLTDVVVPTAIGAVTLLGGPGGYDPHPYSSIALDDSTGGIRIEQARASAVVASDLFLIYDARAGSGVGQAKHSQLAFADSLFETCFDGTVVIDSDCAIGSGSGSGSITGSATIESLQSNDVAIGQTGFVWNCPSPLGSCAGSDVAFGAVDPTDEIAIPVVGANHVPLLTATQGSANDPTTLALAHVQDVALAANTFVAANGRTMFVDVDGDGCTDLVIPVNGVGTAFDIAFNTCSGMLSPAVAVPNAALVHPTTGEGTSRLFVDLNGDGVADVVTSDAIYLAQCEGGGFTGSGSCRTSYTAHAVAAVPRAWTTALAIDINHDGIPDIAGFEKGDMNVDVLLNTDAGTFSRYTLFTDDPVIAIVAGDFDGDLISDLAIVTGQVGTPDEEDALLISYGTPDGGPGDPVPMGTFGAVDSLAPATIRVTANDPEVISDLVVVDDRSGQRTGSVLLGSSTRQVTAPFEIVAGGSIVVPSNLLLGDSPAHVPSQILEISAGATAGSNDTTINFPSIWSLQGDTNGDLTLAASYAAGSGSDNLLVPAFSSGATTSWALGVLDAGAPASAVGVTSLASIGSACGATELLVATPASDASGTFSVAAETPLALPAAGSDCLRVHGHGVRDVDGDGIADDIIQMCASSPAFCQHTYNLIAWGSAGTIDAADAVPLPEPAGMACGRYLPIGLETGSPKLITPCVPEELVTLPTGVTSAYSTPVLVVLSLDTTTTPPTWSQSAAFAIAASDLRIVAGDFNGDGLVDIVLTSGTGETAVAQVYLQCGTNDPTCTPIPEATP